MRKMKYMAFLITILDNFFKTKMVPPLRVNHIIIWWLWYKTY